MRFIGALLLAVLGIGIFPISTRTLFTPTGIAFAALSLALIFFAYRLATHKKKSAPSEPSRGHSEGDAGKPTQQVPDEVSDFVVTPSMPDITKSKPLSGYMLGTRMLMFFQEPQTVAKLPPGSALPLKYLFAASVFDSATRKMERLFTLETGFTSEVFLCAFERNGSHTNIGDGALLNNLRTFESAVLALVSKEWGVPVDHARPIPL